MTTIKIERYGGNSRLLTQDDEMQVARGTAGSHVERITQQLEATGYLAIQTYESAGNWVRAFETRGNPKGDVVYVTVVRS